MLEKVQWHNVDPTLLSSKLRDVIATEGGGDGKAWPAHVLLALDIDETLIDPDQRKYDAGMADVIRDAMQAERLFILTARPCQPDAVTKTYRTLEREFGIAAPESGHVCTDFLGMKTRRGHFCSCNKGQMPAGFTTGGNKGAAIAVMLRERFPDAATAPNVVVFADDYTPFLQQVELSCRSESVRRIHLVQSVPA